VPPGERVLDMGCGAGRHAFEMYRRGADVIAFDQDADELAGVREIFQAMRDKGEVPQGAEADVKEGDALSLPFADHEFDRIVAAEVLEHIPADIQAIQELARVLRPGGTIALSVPRWLPEAVCWQLSDDYHSAPGGHIRIYTDKELVTKAENAGLTYQGTEYAHGLHSPYWWLKCGRPRAGRSPAGAALPPAAGMGHHQAAAHHPMGREGAQPTAGEVGRALLPQARCRLRSRTCRAS
jgi:SAM-dependent methyltransferase